MRIPVLLFAGALVVLVGAIARPLERQRVPQPAGVVVLAIDTSESMKATDIQPTRLDAAKQAATDFIDGLAKGSQVGLVTYSDHAEVLARPTIDHETVIEAIQRIRAGGATALGDALSEALTMARAAVPTGTGPDGRPNAAILLLADGENSAGNTKPLDAAAQAAEQGVPVYTVSLGTAHGELVYGDGAHVPVPAHPSTLRNISQATGGQSFQAPTSPELLRIYDAMSSRFVTFTWQTGEVTWLFALASIPLVAVAAGLSLALKGRFP